MQLELENFLCVSGGFRKENFLVVASDHVAAKHGFGFAYNFENLLVQGGLHNAVVELENHCKLVVAAQLFRD